MWLEAGMKRSAGITVSAVVVFIGSAVTLLFAALMALSAAVSVPNGNLPHGFRYVAMFFVIAAILFVAWGIASGMGLLDRREWARISMIVFAALLLAMAVPGLVMFLFLKLPAPANGPDPEMMQRVMWITRMCGAGLYAFLAVLAATWLWYFNNPATKSQFTSRGSMASSVVELESATRVGDYSGGRPLSITIIAGLMMLGALSLPVLLVVQFPMLFLGYFFTGPKEVLILSVFTVVQITLAYGLWELRPWGRNLAIYWFNFAIFNAIISAILPGAEGRYDAAMATIQSTMNLPAAPSEMHIPLWLGLFFSLPFIAIQLWFLIASKPAFEGPRKRSPLR
jgi:hypothetical protein